MRRLPALLIALLLPILAWGTVPSETYQVSYAGNGVTKEFDVPFQFDSAEDLQVATRSSTGDVTIITTGFTVSGAGTDDGDITFTTAPASGVTIIIAQKAQMVQETDYVPNDAFSAETHEAALDHLTRITHRLDEQLQRSLRVPFGDAGAGSAMELPAKSARLGKYLYFDETTGLPEMATSLAQTTLSASVIGNLVEPQTTAESNAGVTPTATHHSFAPYDVRRAGVTPNSAAARAANSALLVALLDPTEDGITGDVIFPNTTGADIYYLAPEFIEVRDGVNIDCQGSTLDFSGTYDADNDSNGFLTFIRDVTIENCNIVVDYDGSTGTANGIVLRIGGRAATYGFGDDRPGLEEEDLATRMGNIVVRNVRITTNNPDTAAVLVLGGLENTILENVIIDGTDLAPLGIYYEFGQWHYEGGAAGDANITTHATNLRFRNVRVSNIDGVAVSVVGAMTFFADGLWVDDADSVFVARLGEAGYYNMSGTPTETMRAHYDLRNIFGRNISSTAISLLGSESLLSGYLAADIAALAAEAEAQAQTDKITFNLDGFNVDHNIIINAPHVRLANGRQKAGPGSRGIWIQSETMWFEFDNIEVLDNDDTGIASDEGGKIYGTARFRNGVIRNCLIAGNGIDGNDAGIALSQMDGVLIENCRFGYELAHDGVAESTQGAGVSNQATTRNLTIRNSYCGGTASSCYVNAGGGGWKYARIESPGGLRTTSGQWTIDGVGQDADIGDNDTTLDPGTDLPYQRMETTLTGNKTVTLGTCNAAANGNFFELARTGLGSFTVDFGGLKTIASATAAMVRAYCNGSAWKLAAYAPL